MINKLEKEIIFRFLKSRKKDSFLNLISIFSFIGITLGVAVLIIVMSVMNGFRTELINKIVGFNAHAVVKSYDKKLNIDFEKTKNISEEVENIILSNDGEAVIINKNSTKGVLLKGFLSQDFTKLNVLQNKNFFGYWDWEADDWSGGEFNHYESSLASSWLSVFGLMYHADPNAGIDNYDGGSFGTEQNLENNSYLLFIQALINPQKSG